LSGDAAIRISVPAAWGEVAGAMLVDELGAYQLVEDRLDTAGAGMAHLVFYPFLHGAGFVPDDAVLALLPSDQDLRARVVLERMLVPGGWEENWKQHFPPMRLERLYLRPPWEAPCEVATTAAPQPGAEAPLDVVINPGLAFGTGLHATTRGVLRLLQDQEGGGPLVDSGTGSGILAIAACRLGYAPVVAFDDDPLAVEAAVSNAAANGVEIVVQRMGVTDAPTDWFAGATVLANITVGPILLLVERLRGLHTPVRRLVVAGILAGEQEEQVVRAAGGAGLGPARRHYDDEWVTMDFRSVDELSAGERITHAQT